MLSDKSRPVIQATLPAVGAHIQEIAQCFYRKLFSAHPELLDGTFNRGNQADGTQQQALAGSVAAFATSLVNTPDQLPESLLSRIAHKHTSLGIKPEQYQVVHENLMPAIAEVLGDAVTPDVAAAWDEVYWLMAYTLTHVERGLYGARGVRPQTVWRQWEVEKKIHETDDVVTFVVKRIEDHLVKPSLPGQYISVQVPLPDGTRQPRQYSLSRADQGESRQFTVKRVYGAAGKPDGEASTLLHTSVRVGDVLSISVPFGPLVLDDYSGRPMVFISAGIGITPMAGMLSHLATVRSHLPIMLLHADHNESAFALRSQIRDDIVALAKASFYVWYEQGAESQLPVQGVFAGRMDLSQVRLPDDALYHLCGPVPFMHGIRSALIGLGIPPRDIQYEMFGPDLWQAD
ncbi:FAD-binding oxidoreductase [Bradyrhizobium sp. CCGUVB1N3]|uniref:globin domain-containing protein n=1 Tax=Bradyrhizobium sp. CCGUVB1N3 TaxID=2949629 RepID=UPI0020B3F537|nr:globin domain-containing protein [Bradyrhizobium sp. CCGUVB1N3]MCP3469789.1 FAD-binding oxidoreductase [Bradyrhizobium sp. CCGUVB1N3]